MSKPFVHPTARHSKGRRHGRVIRVDALIAQLQKIEEDVQRARDTVVRGQIEIAAIRRILSTAEASEEARVDFPRRKRSESGMRLIPLKAAEVLREHGAPLDRNELVKRIEARGTVIESSAPGKLVSKALGRSGCFHHVPGRGYWVDGLPLPENAEG